MTRDRLHLLAGELLDAFAEGDDVADLNRVRRTVNLLAVHEHMAVRAELTGAPNGAREASATQDIVQTKLKQLQQHFAGVTRAATCFAHIAAELSLKDVVVEANLLLLILADAVVLLATTAEAVHTRGGELALRGVLWDVRDRDTNLARELHLRTEIARHGSSSFLRD